VQKLTILVALFALLAVPALASGHSHPARHHAGVRPAVAACKSERDADKSAFKTKYANKRGRHAMRRCVAQHVRQAVKTCRTERKADSAAFKTKYGNEKGRHAFRRCVRQHESDPVA
jgi:ribosomal protein L14E/L6E/L27E